MQKLNLFKIKVHFSHIKLILSDFDGVMTDGRVEVSETGLESVICSRLDGIGVRLLKNNSIEIAIISSETNDVVMRRAKKLEINAYNNIVDKAKFVEQLLTEKNLSINEVLYIGDEINDFEVMKYLDHTACPSDANFEIQKIAKFILKTKGGYGVIREIADLVCSDKIWR